MSADSVTIARLVKGLFFRFRFLGEYKDMICRWRTVRVGVIAALPGGFGYLAAASNRFAAICKSFLLLFFKKEESSFSQQAAR